MEMVKSVENTRRELFEAWVKSQEKLNIPLNRFANLPIVYSDPITAIAWLAFNAALDSVVIEVPPYHELHEMTSGDLYDTVLVSIESTNLGLKVK